MNITLELTEDQFSKLVDAVAEKVGASKVQVGKPFTVKAFSEASGLSTQTIYRQVEAGQLRRVAGLAKVLIPSSELEKFL